MDEWCTPAEACQLLNVSPIALKRLGGLGLLPTNGGVTSARRYAKDWVRGVAEQLAYYPSLRYVDDVLFELYAVFHAYHDTPEGFTRRRNDVRRAKVKQRLEPLLASGQVWDFNRLSEVLGSTVQVLNRRVREGRMGALRIGQEYYVTETYARYLIKIYTVWKTVGEAAAMWSVPRTTLISQIESGRLQAIKGADNIFRINPKDLAAHYGKSVDEDSVTVDEAVRRLGCGRTSLARAILAGTVASTGQHETRRIPEAEVERWAQWFKNLNPEFAWLQTRITSTALTFSAKQTITALRINIATLLDWSRSGLLPFFQGTFPGAKEYRLFVRQYVEGLARYARGAKIDKKLALAYKQQCQESGYIV